MSDLQGFVVTRDGTNVAVSLPHAVIEFTIADSTTGAIEADFTGARALNWPGVFTQLTAAEKLVLRAAIEATLIQIAQARFP